MPVPEIVPELANLNGVSDVFVCCVLSQTGVAGQVVRWPAQLLLVVESNVKIVLLVMNRRSAVQGSAVAQAQFLSIAVSQFPSLW